MIHRLAATVLGTALVLGAAGAAPAAGPGLEVLGFQAYESPKPAPAFSLPDLDGRTRSLGELRGKIVLVYFWATW